MRIRPSSNLQGQKIHQKRCLIQVWVATFENSQPMGEDTSVWKFGNGVLGSSGLRTWRGRIVRRAEGGGFIGMRRGGIAGERKKQSTIRTLKLNCPHPEKNRSLCFELRSNPKTGENMEARQTAAITHAGENMRRKLYQVSWKTMPKINSGHQLWWSLITKNIIVSPFPRKKKQPKTQ